MGKYFVNITQDARKHIALIHKSGEKSAIKRIEQILLELLERPEVGIGNPEMLKFNWAGYWSRRINKKDRMIYKIEEKIITVTVIAALKHYGDK